MGTSIPATPPVLQQAVGDDDTVDVTVYLREGKLREGWDALASDLATLAGGTLSGWDSTGPSPRFEWRGTRRSELMPASEDGRLDACLKAAGAPEVLEITSTDGEHLYEWLPAVDLRKAPPLRDADLTTTKRLLRKTDVLIVTATPVESATVLSHLRPLPGEDAVLTGSWGMVTYRFGQFGRYRTAHVRCTMGSGGTRGAALTTEEAIREAKPKVVLVLGIAFGASRRKFRLGDVLVAEQIAPYELAKVSPEELLPRSVPLKTGELLAERFANRSDDWRHPRPCGPVAVYQGLVLSGEKVVANEEFRDALHHQYSTAIGGEMEGSGAYAAAVRHKKEILLAKGICDWADGQKNDRAQAFAAEAAVSLAEHVLSKPDVLHDLKAHDCGVEALAPASQLSHREAVISLLRDATLPPVKLPAATFVNQQLVAEVDVVSAQGNNYINATHIQETAAVFNHIRMERRWSRPLPPPLLRDVINRKEDLNKVEKLLAERGQLAISGRIAATAVQGMPGIGKTTLAMQLALLLAPRYADGVLWEDIGPGIQASEVQPILDRWARYALVVPQGAASLHFEPSAVRALLGEHPHLLVVLDNVWSIDTIRPLREALPKEASLVVTTRSKTVLFALGGASYEMHDLSSDDARALIALRFGWQEVALAEQGWCDELSAGVGHHTLALDVALGLILREGGTADEWRALARRIVDNVRKGTDFDDLRIDEDPERNVRRVLSHSYERLDETAQRYFRLLGAFAPDVDFGTGFAAKLWQCDEGPAKKQLDKFVNAALLSRAGDGRWKQHSLLRGYALNLLGEKLEFEAASARHSAIYEHAMHAANAAQRFYIMLPEMAQLRHAFAWAVDNHLQLARNLASYSAELQWAFGLVRENLEWCERILATARQRGTPRDVAYGCGVLGNALQRGANLRGEGRGVLLLRALDLYEEALRFFTSDADPFNYAITQENRAILLSDIAFLTDEDRRARLHQALTANTEALCFRNPDSVPRECAATQNNRAAILGHIALLPEEDRRARLHEALTAYTEALRFLSPEASPLGYATVQNNRAILFESIAFLPNEERRACLFQALDAYDDALRFRTPGATPLAYAITQNNRGSLLANIALLPDEEGHLRLLQAIAAFEEAFRFLTPDTSPLDYAMAQGNLASVFLLLADLHGEDRQHLLAAALKAAWTAFTLFGSSQHTQYRELATQQLQILKSVCGDTFDTLWEGLDVGPLPSELLHPPAPGIE